MHQRCRACAVHRRSYPCCRCAALHGAGKQGPLRLAIRRVTASSMVVTGRVDLLSLCREDVLLRQLAFTRPWGFVAPIDFIFVSLPGSAPVVCGGLVSVVGHLCPILSFCLFGPGPELAADGVIRCCAHACRRALAFQAPGALPWWGEGWDTSDALARAQRGPCLMPPWPLASCACALASHIELRRFCWCESNQSCMR